MMMLCFELQWRCCAVSLCHKAPGALPQGPRGCATRHKAPGAVPQGPVGFALPVDLADWACKLEYKIIMLVVF